LNDLPYTLASGVSISLRNVGKSIFWMEKAARNSSVAKEYKGRGQ